ncbi:RimK family alpha-L-glutamate ligase [Streptomyces sp. NPDC051217]|uniref:RimK family alpha-L-glutamate ligase n=1 Tax=Streptomyces sp. NPDC051217 TaxID=3365644 RepID=UPI0037B0CCE1
MDSEAGPVLITDHSSMEGSREYLVDAVKHCTGRSPVLVDAQNFFPGGGGRVESAPKGLSITTPLAEGPVMASVVIVYEIPPERRRDFEDVQHVLHRQAAWPLATAPERWRAATEKDLMVDRFTRHGIPYAETVVLDGPGDAEALDAFRRLGGNVWARPAVGMGGADVFHITSTSQLRRAAAYYGDAERKWLMARDALNFNARGKRHQFRIIVLNGTVLQVCEHVQDDPDAPCNESQGAAVEPLATDAWPDGLCRLAVASAKAMGLPFTGVDLAPEGGGVVFEANVHPAFSPGSFEETTALPYVRAHLAGQRR